MIRDGSGSVKWGGFVWFVMGSGFGWTALVVTNSYINL